ncbi:uncharacterized protein [Haliotis asinina]|uniref:uncharacterized protein n=1 Tax=Haliotis asinina TaxID=109174 RepID=UPI00353204D9
MQEKSRESSFPHPRIVHSVLSTCVCYGFSLMQDAESPNVPFTLLCTRFKKALKMMVYDNACNLHAYCMNRDPGFFKNTWSLVDRFHWPNHNGCHDGYHACHKRRLSLS